MVLGGQTGTRFRVGIGGITAPNATLEVSGTVNVTGSLTVSGSSTFTNFGKAVLYANAKNEEDLNTSLPDNRALEVSGTTRFHGNTYVTGNLYVTDIVVAQEFHTEYVSASITFSSGSNKMGDTNDDIQHMTGSLRVSGSGPHYYMGKNPTGGPGAAGNAKVGINTINPTYELDVAGDIGVDRDIIHNGDTDTKITFTSDDIALLAGSSTNPKINVTSTGVVFNQNHEATYDFRVEGDADTHLIFADAGVDRVGIGTSAPVHKLQVFGPVSASGIVYGQTGVSGSWVSASQGIWTGGDISGSGHLNVGGNITASGNISASGYISSSIFAGLSASISHILCTGSGGDGRGTGSFGRINVDRIVIHNHEIVGGQGLSVIGQSTNLGTAGYNNQPITCYGNITGSNIWMSGSSAADGGGNISASSMTLTNNLSILGNISGSWISASKGLWTSGTLAVGSHTSLNGNVTASGEISASSTGSFAYLRVAANPVPGAPTNYNSDGITLAEFVGETDSIVINNAWGTGDYYIGNSANNSGHVFRDGEGGVLSIYNNTVGQQLTAEGTYFQKPTTATENKYAGTGNVLQVEGNMTGSGALTVQGSGSFGGHVTASGNISSSGTGSFGYLKVSANPVPGAPGASSTDLGITLGEFVGESESFVIKNASYAASSTAGDYYIGNSAYQNGFVFRDGSGGLASLYNNTLASRLTAEGLYLQKPTAGDGLVAAAGNVLQVEGNISGSGNLDVEGSIRASGSIASTNYRTMYIAAGGMTPNATDGADTGTVELGGSANKNTVDYLAFDTGTDEHANFQMTMPYEWDQGTVKAIFYYKLTDGQANPSSHNIAFGINGATIPTDASIIGDQNSFAVVLDVPADDADVLQTSGPVSFTIAGTHVAGGASVIPNLVFFRVMRDISADNYGHDALLIGVAIQYKERVDFETVWS